MSSGLRIPFDREIADIEKNMLQMRELVDQAILRGYTSLAERDADLARQVIADDDVINGLRFTIEEASLTLIATQQPTATDLRRVIAIMNIVVDLERMGDYATGIATTVLLMGDEPLLKPLIDLPKMVELAREMLNDSVQALLDQDVDHAKEIAARDDEMDELYREIFDELVEIMAKRPEGVQRATYLLWCAHNVERMGDRVTNIAERVVFVSTGDMQELNIKEDEY
jgi:phosphate transport system protein